MASVAHLRRLFGRLNLRWLVCTSLAAAAATTSYACAYSEIGPTPAEQARIHAEDQRLRERAPKESMILVWFPGKPEWRERYLIEWNRWLKLSPAQREKFRQDPLWERTQWFATHGNPKPGTHAYGSVAVSWNLHGRPLWTPVGFGHRFEMGSGTCEGNLYWSQVYMDLHRQLVRAPRQADGSVIAALYGYKLPWANPYLDGEFVVLSYRFCRGPIGANGQCP